ncbi:MAG: hypothetical protein WA139_02895 [Candidatus Aenigmatarchaeota archaeon]
MKNTSAKKGGGAQGKAVAGMNAAAGGASIISAHNVCHAVCEGLVGIAAVFGITGMGMPLAFLTDYNIYFWAMALAFLLIGLALLVSKRCISKNMMMFNGGIVLAGVPFAFLSPVLPVFWAGGSVLILFSAYRFLKQKMSKKNKNSR